jgi:hypothetical protein
VKRVTRDLVFIDSRYVVLRDRVELTTPGKLSWLLHAERHLAWDGKNHLAFIRGDKAALTTRVIAPGVSWNVTVTDQFPVPVDPKYAEGEITGSYLTGKWQNQQHLTLESNEPAASFTIWTVLWPERDGTAPVAIEAEWKSSSLVITRPDGRIDSLTLTDDTIALR